MFWILRRTGAANFFNSFNNNYSTSKGTNNNSSSSSSSRRDSNSNISQNKCVKRPPRKAYGRLNAESDDVTIPIKQKMSDSFDDIDNLKPIPSNINSISHGNPRGDGDNSIHNNNPKYRITAIDAQYDEGKHVMHCSICDMSVVESHTVSDCQGNCGISGHLSHILCGDGGDDSNRSVTTLPHSRVSAKKIKSSLSYHRSCTKEVNQTTINRLQAMAISEDDYDELLTCNVCDRAFHCQRQLASHQQKKRHFGCNGCDSLFSSLMLLEHHKEEFEHWSDDEMHERLCCRRSNDYLTDTDSFSSEAESEDLERLL